MKKIINYILIIAFISMFSSCMEDVGDYTVKGEAITGFELQGPDNNDTIKINTLALTETFAFEWAAAESGLGSPITYTILFDAADGDFTNPIWSKQSDNSGANTKATLTFEELQQIYSAAGNSGVASLKWNVKAENGSPNVKLGQVANNLKIVLSSDGVSNFNLVSPLDKSIVQFNGSKADDPVVFDWDDATSGSGTITYKLYIDALNGDFSDPLLTLDADDNGTASQISKTNSEWKNLLEQNGIEEGSFIWTVKASSTDLEWTSNIYEVYFEFVNWSKLPIYIVGEATEVGWSIEDAIELNWSVGHNAYIGYIPLKNGNFKFFPVKGSWDNGMGRINDSEDPKGGLLGGENKNIPSRNTSSEYKLYRIAVWYDEDEKSYKYSALDAEMVLVGDATPAGWSIDNGYNMVYAGEGKWVTYVDMNASGGYKFFYQTGNWNSGYKEFDPANKPGKLSLEGGDPNISTPGDGYYKLTIDVYNMTYTKELIAERKMYLVGSPNGWNINAGIEMTWDDTNKEWTLTTDLAAGDAFKIFAESGNWNSGFKFKYEMLSFEGGDPNISTPDGAGNYTIKFSLAKRTLTFTKN